MNRLDAEKVSHMGDSRAEDAVVEIPVLLESHFLNGLEAAARDRGMTAGALVRCLLRDFLCYSDSVAPDRTSLSDSRKAFLC
jgi:hypothetical protein